jgi:hypothetical protein
MRLQCRATVQPRVADRLQAWLVAAMTRQDGTALQTTHNVTRPTVRGAPLSSVYLYHLMP